MATHAARRLADLAGNGAIIVGIELLTAAQGIDLRRPRATSRALQRATAMVREAVPFLDRDRRLAPDIAAAAALVAGGAFRPLLPRPVLPSEA